MADIFGIKGLKMETKRNQPTQFASTFKNRTGNHTTKVFKRACKANPRKEIIKNAPPHDYKIERKKEKNEKHKPLTIPKNNPTGRYRLFLAKPLPTRQK